jgi:hypothetical protein
MKMNRWLFICVLTVSCSTVNNRQVTGLRITIRESQSYKIDLMANVYTVYFNEKPPVNIPFVLSIEELEKIKKEYNSIGLPRRSRRYELVDKCNIMPKLYTFIEIESDTFKQEVRINETCENFRFDHSKKAARVRKFLASIRAMLHSKPEIKNAPVSDIAYM